MNYPSLSPIVFDLLEDPIVKILMAYDGIDVDSVLRTLDDASARLRTGQAIPIPVAGSEASDAYRVIA